MTTHEQVEVTFTDRDGIRTIDVDHKLTSLVRSLNEMGLTTLYSCQNQSELTEDDTFMAEPHWEFEGYVLMKGLSVPPEQIWRHPFSIEMKVHHLHGLTTRWAFAETSIPLLTVMAEDQAISVADIGNPEPCDCGGDCNE